MKRGWMMLLAMLFVVTCGVAARGQAAIYGEFSASNLAGGPKGDYLYGFSGGVLVDGPSIYHRVHTAADIGGRFVGTGGERLDGVTIGPRFSLNPVFLKIAPYVAFDVGFARYNDGSGNSTTDNIFGGSGGLTRQITPHLDAMVEYRYESYGTNFNMYNPASYSGGVIYHFTKR